MGCDLMGKRSWKDFSIVSNKPLIQRSSDICLWPYNFRKSLHIPVQESWYSVHLGSVGNSESSRGLMHLLSSPTMSSKQSVAWKKAVDPSCQDKAKTGRCWCHASLCTGKIKVLFTQVGVLAALKQILQQGCYLT